MKLLMFSYTHTYILYKLLMFLMYIFILLFINLYHYNATSNVWICHIAYIIFSTFIISSPSLPHLLRICVFWLSTHSLQISDSLLSIIYNSPPIYESSSKIHLIKSILLKLSLFPAFNFHGCSSWKLFHSSFTLPHFPFLLHSQQSVSFSFPTHHWDSLLHWSGAS